MQVTLEKAKNYLRVDSSDDDALIESLITTAETLVKETSRMSDEELTPYKEVVEIAELFTIAYLYEHREEADYKNLTETVKYLLFPIRKEVF
ncbi:MULTISPECIES: head-tail connector protein [unclassified Blautia]|uniref:head-tail connector protein n=1 Tax=unclassified Blautia TaxID=2648079 RepID=UPI003F8CBB89